MFIAYKEKNDDKGFKLKVSKSKLNSYDFKEVHLPYLKKFVHKEFKILDTTEEEVYLNLFYNKRLLFL